MRYAPGRVSSGGGQGRDRGGVVGVRVPDNVSTSRISLCRDDISMRRNLKTLGPLPLLVAYFVFDIISIVVEDAGEDHQALNREQTPPKRACKLLVPGCMQGKPFLSRSVEKSKDVTEMESCSSTVCWRDEGGRIWFNKGDASSDE